jgi:K+-sensing histidine kinase KdpD
MRLWVSDTGRGVSPEDQAKAFDAFESRGPSAGAGIGLTLVQRFISLHGGWVRLESEPGRGTRVNCFLPTGEARESAPSQDVSRAEAEQRAPAPKPAVKRAARVRKPRAEAAE